MTAFSVTAKITDTTTGLSKSSSASATIIASTAVQPFSTGAYLLDPPSAANMAGYDKFIGHPITFVTCFGSRDTVDHLEHPDYLVDPIVAAGKIPCISFQGILSGGSENLGNVSTQTLHDRAVAFGQWLVSKGKLGALAAIRMRTEANNTSAGDPATNVWDPSSVSQYAAAISAIYQGLKSVAGQQFLCLADVAFDPGNNADLRIMLQAVNASCDGYGLDDYDTVSSWGSAYTNATDEWNGRYNGVNGGIGYKAYMDLARANNKWIAVPEFGLGYFYSNNGASQTPADDEGYFISEVYSIFTDPTLKVALVDFWEDNNGLYLTGGQSLPRTTATFLSTFGALPSAPWPRGSVTPPPPPPPATVPGFVQAVLGGGPGAAVTKYTLPFSKQNVKGDIGIVWVTWDTTNKSKVTLTDTDGNTWTPDVAGLGTDTADSQAVQRFRCTSLKGTSALNVLSANFSPAAGWPGIAAYEGKGTFDIFSTPSVGSSSSAHSGSILPGKPGATVVGVCFNTAASQAGITAGSGWNPRGASATATSTLIEDMSQTTSAVVSATFTLGIAGAYVADVFSFIPTTS